jgi:toxic protein SymE
LHHHTHPKTRSSAARYTYSPSINLKGDWLEQAGFDTGVKIDVRVMAGCLMITARQPEIMQTLKKVCKLSARKQRQVTELIEVISKPQ